MANELLVFHMDDSRFGMPSSQVREVLRAATISPVADAPSVMMGVINLRGQVVAVLDARRLLGFSDRPIRHTDHLVVAEIAGRRLAVRVDRALELVAVEQIDCPPAGVDAVGRAEHRFAKTSAGLVQVVDLGRCLADAESALPDADALRYGAEATT